MENIFSLSLVESSGYLLPLLTVPYLLRVLGPEKFGLVTFAQAFTQYFVIITDYGFNFSATRRVSVNRHDQIMLSRIVGAVIIIKLLLFFLSFIILSVLVFSILRFRIDWSLYYLSFGIVMGNVLLPIWFFRDWRR